MEKFDGLQENYDLARPRYPDELLKRTMALLAPSDDIKIVDAGSGTGILLESLSRFLPTHAEVHCVDISAGMIEVGQRKFPQYIWHHQTAEDFLERQSAISLVTAGQSYQWMDRMRFLKLTERALRQGGVCQIIQNNRDHRSSTFAAVYEELLEKYSPGYRRDYRDFNIQREVESHFAETFHSSTRWTTTLTTDQMLLLSMSSTQAQRAMKANREPFLNDLRAICKSYSTDDTLRLEYVSESYWGIKDGKNKSY